MGDSAGGSDRSIESLIREAELHPTSGWDFSWLGARHKAVPPPWDFEGIVAQYARRSPDMLDMGTGGGEWLAALPHRPPRTVATEAWPPNVPVAKRRLNALGIEVVQVDGAPDNNSPGAEASSARLPFPDESFRLVSNRHESFVAREVARILAPEGHFVTQQMGDGTYRDVRELLGAPTGEEVPFTVSMAAAQLEHAGLSIEMSSVGRETNIFADVGALTWYLKMIPWEVPDFTVERYRDRLAELHARIASDGPIAIHEPCFWLAAQKRRMKAAV